jgi:hypothetical protein
MEKNTCVIGLLRRRQCPVPTWRGWLALLLALGLVWLAVKRNLHEFLAVTKPVSSRLLVIEGWMPDYAMEIAMTEFHTNHYERLFVIGGPLDTGTHLSRFGNFAELGAATLVEFGLSSNVVQAVPAKWVRQDRTYAAGVALKRWLEDHGISADSVNLLSMGPHARRSRLMLQKALGKEVAVGVISIRSVEYDPAQWWRSSAGVRTVLDEAFAYAYARLLFHPPKAEGSQL